MRTIVVGGGLLGLCTASALVNRGEDVLVLEAREDVGLEASFANGGMLTPSLPEPWNGPGVLKQLMKSLIDPAAAVKLNMREIPSLIGWGLDFLVHSTAEHHHAAAADNYRLARYSLGLTLDAGRRFGLDCDLAEGGSLCIFTDAAGAEARLEACRRLSAHGVAARVCSSEEVAQIEPALAPIAAQLAGGIWLPDDARGDAHRFCTQLAAAIVGQGAELRTDTRVTALLSAEGRMTGVSTPAGRLPAQNVIVAAGTATPHLLQTLGEALAVQPAKGYSITVNEMERSRLPRVTIVDDQSHTVFAALGNRLRVAGTAEFAGFDTTLPPARVQNLFRSLHAVLPELSADVDRRRVEAWAGLRPLSSDGRPFIGPGRTRGLWLNTGHGALGWTMAMGSGELLADQLTGRSTAIDPTPFLPARAAPTWRRNR